MRNKLLITTILSFIMIGSNAQTLKVIYKEKLNLEEKFKDVEDPSWRKLLMDGAKKPNYYELINCKGISIFQQNKQEEEVDRNSGMRVFGESNTNDIFYRNHNQRTYTTQADFMSRVFLINGKLEQPKWELTDKIINIGKYKCSKAFLTRDSTKITAWFTLDIPSNEGPKDFWGLPGLILKVETKLFTLEATKISVKKESTEIEKPKKGKKMTHDAFAKMKKEKTEELKNRGGRRH